MFPSVLRRSALRPWERAPRWQVGLQIGHQIGAQKTFAAEAAWSTRSSDQMSAGFKPPGPVQKIILWIDREARLRREHDVAPLGRSPDARTSYDRKRLAGARRIHVRRLSDEVHALMRAA